ncbi:MAG: AI-2E family transporter [Spirochaetota bacterium]
MSDHSGLQLFDQSRFTSSLLFILTIIAVGAVFKLTASIVQPLVIALLLSFVLNPLVEVLHRLRLPRIVGILIVIALLLGFGSLVALFLYSSVQGVVRQLPRYIDRLVELVRQLLYYFELPQAIVAELDLTRQLGGYLVSFSGSFLSVLGSLTMTLVFLLFILLEKPYIRPKVMEALHGPRTEKLWRIVGHTNAQIGRYLSVKLFVSLATGILVWGAFRIIGVEFAFIWGVLSFLFNFIPSIGSIVIGATSVVFALVQFYPDPNPVVAAAVSMLTIQLVLGNVIDPKLQGDSLKISPVVILFSLLFWGWLWGIVGLFLAVPLTVALKIVFENIPGYEFVGVLMGRTASEEDAPESGTRSSESDSTERE